MAADVPVEVNPERRRQLGKAVGEEIRRALYRKFASTRKRDGAPTSKGALRELQRRTGIPYPSLWQFKEGLMLPGKEKLRILCGALDLDEKKMKSLYPDGHTFKRGRQPGASGVRTWFVGRRRFVEWIREKLANYGILGDLAQVSQFCLSVCITEGYYRLLVRGKVNIPSWNVLRRMAKHMSLGIDERYFLYAFRVVANAPNWLRPRLIRQLMPGEEKLIKETRESDA